MVSEEMKKCPHCGQEILSVAKKCKYCGEWIETPHNNTDISEQVQCPICGEMIDHNTEYCPYCKENVAAYLSKEVAVNIEENTQIAYSDTNSSFFTKYRKILLASIVVVLLVGVGAGIVGYLYYQKQEAAETAQIDNDKNYLAAAKSFKNYATEIHEKSIEILEDYVRNWRTAIYDNQAEDVTGKKKWCKDFDEGVTWRIIYYSDDVTALEEKQDKMIAAFKKMESLDCPNNLKPLRAYYDKIRGQVSEAIELCNQPTGNYEQFSRRVDDLRNELRNSLSQTDIYVD